MNDNELPIAREWLCVDEAFLACQQKDLNRTKKTIRSWCRNEHVEAQKQTTPTGERWMVEKTSLAVKIRAELEFQRQSERVQTGSNPSEQVQPKAEQVRTSAQRYEPGLTRANESDQETNGMDAKVARLESDLRSLEIDKAVRDRHIDFLTEQNSEGQQGLLSQSRYIGHLETQVLQLGGQPDQRFLEAPVPRDEVFAEPETLNPHQQPLDPVHS